MPQSASKVQSKAQEEIQKHIDHDHGFYCARFETNEKNEEVGASTVKPLMEVTVVKMDNKEGAGKVEERQSARIEKSKIGPVDSMSATPIKDRLKAKAEKRKDDQAHHLRCCMAQERFRHNPFWHADCCPLNEGSKNGGVQCTPIPSPRRVSGPLTSRITLQQMPPSKPVTTSAPTPIPIPLHTPMPLQKNKNTQTDARGQVMEEEVRKTKGLIEKMQKEVKKVENKMKEQQDKYKETYKQMKEKYEGFISSAADRNQALQDQIIKLTERCAKMKNEVTGKNTAIIKMEKANAKEQEALKNELRASNQAVNAGKRQIEQQKKEIFHLREQFEAATEKEMKSASTIADQNDKILQLKNALTASTNKEKGTREILDLTNVQLQIKVNEVENLQNQLCLKSLMVQEKENDRKTMDDLQKKMQMLELENQRHRSRAEMFRGKGLLSISTASARVPLPSLNQWTQSSLADSPRSRPTSVGVATTNSAEHWNQPPPSILAPISLTGGGSESSGSASLVLHQLSTSTANSTRIQDPLAMFSTLLSRTDTRSTHLVPTQFSTSTAPAFLPSNAPQLTQFPTSLTNATHLPSSYHHSNLDECAMCGNPLSSDLTSVRCGTCSVFLHEICAEVNEHQTGLTCGGCKGAMM